ncbi:MAG: BpuSI family type II restriction endonuclease [Bacteroidales bacterium]|nr:BpuSI family type II restriction endonuclease [Bacteroidales bacterium]
MIMWISYSDKEVECYHPICETILNNALSILGVSDTYKVEHHRCVGSLEMDFVISNVSNSKILCVIEVKRTIEAVLSTRYQLQAMGYVQQLRPTEKESDYYILTNLEAVGLYYYSPSRQSVVDQLLNPGIQTIARFHEYDKHEFIEILSHSFASLLKRILNREVDYYQSFAHFVQEISDPDNKLISDERLWHSKFAALSYEYIRGALDKIGRPQLIDIRRLHNDIRKICEEALRINFKGIFGLSESEYLKLPPIASSVYGELYDLGKSFLDADAISDILFNIIAKESPYPGAVPTDSELAKSLFILANSFASNLNENQCIIDPAAGSGNLLAVSPFFYPNLTPKQLRANDINAHLLQVLSLRLGLKFPSVISKEDSPQISAFNIADIPQSYFNDVRIAVLNPPYYSHTSVASCDYKETIYRRIKDISGNEPLTESSKSSLEAAFIELVADLLPDEATFACIIPLSHILGKGESSVLFRKMLMQKFGLECIFCYPQQKIFKSVTQNTCVIIGNKGSRSETISFITSNDTLDNIDYDALRQASIDDDFKHSNGIEKVTFHKDKLIQSINEGWRLNSLATEAMAFIENSLYADSRFSYLSDIPSLENHRGRVGNSGGSDLIFINSNKSCFRDISSIIQGHTSFGVRTIRSIETPYLSETDTLFLDASTCSDELLSQIVSIYKTKYEPKDGRQARFSKSIPKYIDLLRKEARFSEPAGSVYLARDVRRNGKAYFTTSSLFPTTNVWVFPFDDERTGKFYHSWFCSIFYQLNCELVAKNHAGARKMDKSEFDLSIVPIIDLFDNSDVDEICKHPVTEFITLNNPEIRNCDKAWAKIISPNAWEDLLNEAKRYLQLLAIERES